MNRKTLARKAIASLFMSMLCLLSYAQTRQVTGLVTDANGEPMIGVNVTVVGTTNGTITDIDGNYSLSVASNAKLQFSFIGYLSKTVEVGTQVSGVIEKLFVDFNSEVKKGQLLAQLDETPLMAQLDQSKASVDQAEAQVKYQKATYERYKALLAKKLIAQSDFDLAEFNYNNALGSLNNAKSMYDKNKINLSYARIYSPIDGTEIIEVVEK